jgi:hypothetical protein
LLVELKGLDDADPLGPVRNPGFTLPPVTSNRHGIPPGMPRAG